MSTDEEPGSDRRPQKPATIPPPNPTAAAVRAEFVEFKRELFAYFDDKEVARGVLLDQRDANVMEHFREMREDVRKLSEEISGAIPKLREDVQRLDQEVDGHDWWRTEFRERTHGIRNAFMAVIGAIGDLMIRLDKVDGLGADIEPLMNAVARLLTFHKNDTDIAPPPVSTRAEIPPPPPGAGDG